MLFCVGLYDLSSSFHTLYCNLSYTALLLAAVEGNSEAVEVLLRNGADIYVQDKDDKSVLYWAAAQNHQSVIRVCSSCEEYLGKTEIQNSIQISLLQALRNILNSQVLLQDPRTFKLFDVCDRGNNSPLHVAAKKGYLSIVLDLIKVHNCCFSIKIH